MQGVRAPSGQTAPLPSRVKVCSETPYWTYSTLVGGGAAVCAAAARGDAIVAAAKHQAKTSRKPALPGFLSDSDRLFDISFFHRLDESQTIRLKPGQARQD